MKKYKPTGISLPDELLKEIDNERGDISRSRYLLRLLEKQYKCNQCGKNKSQDPLDCRFPSLQTSASVSQ